MNIHSFLARLALLRRDSQWTSAVEGGCIHLRHTKCDIIFVPLTAMYYDLTGIEIHRGSFWVEEMTKLNGFSPFDLLRISHATFACNCVSVVGQGYDHALRQRMLNALGLT